MMNKSTLLDKTKLTPGVSHWLIQRITAVLLIPLTYPLIHFLNLCMTAPYEQTVVWLKSPINLIYFMIWILAAFYHAALGLQVVIEDYVGDSGLQKILIKLINWSFLGLGLIAMVFVFRVS